jgi:hypothetical protein
LPRHWRRCRGNRAAAPMRLQYRHLSRQTGRERPCGSGLQPDFSPAMGVAHILSAHQYQ